MNLLININKFIIFYRNSLPLIEEVIHFDILHNNLVVVDIVVMDRVVEKDYLD
jgi:hypothetical protein